MRLTTYSDKQKIDAVKLWLVTGNLTTSAGALGIPYETMKSWRYSKWWSDLAVEIKSEGRMELGAKLKKIAEKALDLTLDSLEEGDWVMSPTGALTRKPVSAATAAKIATDFIEKAEELDRTQESGNLQTVQDRLNALATSFESFSKKVHKIEVVDVESREIVDEVLPELSTVQVIELQEDRGGEDSRDQLGSVPSL
jgi:hypothetical protein